MKEIWKIISGYESYQVSNFGRIKSHDVIKKNQQWGKYQTVVLCKNGICKTFRIHNIVADTFLHKVKGKEHINHKDGNKLNNHISNLEWVTPSENLKHAFSMGLKEPTKYWTNKFGKDNPKSKKVMCIETKVIYSGMADAARIICKNSKNGKNIARSIKTGIKAIGFHWKFV